MLIIKFLSFSFNRSYISWISDDGFIRPLKRITGEQFAKLQIEIKLSVLIPAFPVSTCDINCGFKDNFSAKVSCVNPMPFLISRIFWPNIGLPVLLSIVIFAYTPNKYSSFNTKNEIDINYNLKIKIYIMSIIKDKYNV